MKGMFSGYVEKEIKKKVGRLYRKAARLRIEGIYESALAPLIAKELKKHPGAYIKSHPKGLRNGVSRIELDVVMVSEQKALAAKTVEEIVGEAARMIRAGGGSVVSARGVRIERSDL
jgi:molybdopterin-biosynthesis enzyme MoeA-like protein